MMTMEKQPIESRVLLLSHLPDGIGARTLQGAFYALMNSFVPDLTKEEHESPFNHFSLYRRRGKIIVGTVGSFWSEFLNGDRLKEYSWQLGSENVSINAVAERELFSVPGNFPSVALLHFRGPVIFRDSKRKAIRKPDLTDIFGNTARRIGLSKEQVVEICQHIKVRGRELKSCKINYGFQQEPSLTGRIGLDLSELPENLYDDCAYLLRGLDALGCGCKTSMGFGATEVEID
jgi:CRISPR/Cas system endoribonuclease Cas6 (RAMP superfamily)